MAPPPRKQVIRSSQLGLLDTFLVSAVLTVLTLRVYLAAANYPRLGGGGLHIAHVLWGGLGMVVAIVLLLSFLSWTTRLAAALVGGVGFGAFVDELGKFLTSDNNYFFKPTAALIYTIFVVLFLLARRLRGLSKLTPLESLVNAIELSKQLAVGGLTSADRDQGLALLAAADQANALVPGLREQFLAAEPQPGRPSRPTRVAGAARRRYVVIVGNAWFKRAVAGIFILQAVGSVLTVVAAVVLAGAVALGNGAARSALPGSVAAGPTPIIEVGASLLAGAFTVVGVIALRRSRLRAYRAFELAVLVDLLLAQPFTLLDAGFGGLAEVFIDLALLVTLRYMQAQERHLVARGLLDVDSKVRRTGDASARTATIRLRPTGPLSLTQLSGINVGWVLGGGLAALVTSVAATFGVIISYAFGLGLLARGTPDSAAIGSFANDAAGWSPIIGTALGAVVGGMIASRKARSDPIINSVAVGVVYSMALLLALPFSHRGALLVLLRVAEALLVCVVIGLWTSRRQRQRVHQ